MAIIRVKKAWDLRRARLVVGSSTFVNNFYVETDDHETDETEVVLAIDPDDNETRVPRVGSAHPKNPYARVQSVDGVPKDKDPHTWVVTVTYSTLVGNEATQQESDPTLRPPTWGWRTDTSFEEYAFDAVDGDPVVNSAGEPFDPSPQRRTASLVLWLRWNRLEFSPSTAVEYINTINSIEFRVVGVNIGAKEALLIQYSAERMSEGGLDFFQLSAELLFRRPKMNQGVTFSGWADFLLCMGYTAIDDQGERYQIKIRSRETVEDLSNPGQFTEREGEPVSPQTPMKLNAEGHLITDNAVAANVRVFQPYELKDLRGLFPR